MKKTLIGAIAAVFVITMPLSATPPQQQVPLTITFETNAIVVHDATPGGDVVIYAMSRIDRPDHPQFRHSEGVVKAWVPPFNNKPPMLSVADCSFLE